jgi:hypothetical protein
MKKTMLALARGCALIAILGHFSAKPVMAQVRAALVKNIDEPGRSPFTLRIDCNGSSNFCVGTSATAVPAHKRFVVQYVNGGGGLNGSLASSLVSVANGSFLYLDPHFISNAFGFSIYAISMPVVAYFEAGQTPSVQIDATPDSSAPDFTITLTGYLIDLTE